MRPHTRSVSSSNNSAQESGYAPFSSETSDPRLDHVSHRVTSTLDHMKTMLDKLEPSTPFENGMKDYLNFLHCQFTELKIQVDRVQSDNIIRNRNTMECVDELALSCVKTEQYSRRDTVTVVGLAKPDNEQQSDLTKKVAEVLSTSGETVTESDLSVVHRNSNHTKVIRGDIDIVNSAVVVYDTIDLSRSVHHICIIPNLTIRPSFSFATFLTSLKFDRKFRTGRLTQLFGDFSYKEKMTSTLIPHCRILLSQTLLLVTFSRITLHVATWRYDTSKPGAGWRHSVCTTSTTSATWASLLVTSGVVSMVTYLKTVKPDWGTCVVVSFLVSFVVGLSTSGVGDMVVFCSRFGGNFADTALLKSEVFEVMRWYNLVTGLVFTILFLLLVWRFVRKAPKSTKGDKKVKILPPTDIVLSGVCLAVCVEKFISGTTPSLNKSVLCTNSGIVSWLTLMTISGILTVVIMSRRHDTNDCLFRGFLTVVSTFVLNFSVGLLGELALSCMINQHMETGRDIDNIGGSINNRSINSINSRDWNINSSGSVEDTAMPDLLLMYHVGTTPVLALTGLVVPVQFLFKKRRSGDREHELIDQGTDT
ncbi:hypothetical protein ACHWQZ_G019554 [Mnemiopsis leidyi]